MARMLIPTVVVAWIITCSLGQIYNPIVNVNIKPDHDGVSVNHDGVSNKLPLDCQDVLDQGSNQTGIYTISPTGTRGFPVRCDMDTENGGWVVVQRRVWDSDFYKTWAEYQVGFGQLSDNFWLGNQQMHMITAQGWYELRVDMTHPNGTSAYASYNLFEVGDRVSNYMLTVEGYHGNAGDSMKYHNGRPFSTKDRDNDANPSNCAVINKGAWWHGTCHHSNLNGDYGNTEFGDGLTWQTFTTFTKSLVKTEMKVRRWSRSGMSASVSADG